MDRLTEEQRHKNMQRIKSKDTKIEIIFRKALRSRGISYRKNYAKIPGKPDIAITKYKIAVFCDSEFFHGKDWEELKTQLERGKNPRFWIDKIEGNIRHDDEVNKILRSKGWTVLRFWGKTILKNPDECVQAVLECIQDIQLTEFETEEIDDV